MKKVLIFIVAYNAEKKIVSVLDRIPHVSGNLKLVPQQNLWVVFGSGKSPIVWNSAIFATS